MDVRALHPSYTVFLKDWTTMMDCYRGERYVKDMGTTYLPPTPGQVYDGMTNINDKGRQSYEAYKMRARFPDFVSQAVEAMLGVMHRKPAVITLPKKMEPLVEKATIKGESLQMLLRRVNTSQLVCGRLGLLGDIPDGAGPDVLPYISLYEAPTILNWDDERRGVMQIVSLDETEYERTNVFEWSKVQKTRLLVMKDGVYQTGIFTGAYDEQSLFAPSIAGMTLPMIPFVVVNSKDIVVDPDDPPLLGLAQLALGVYRSEADYRQALFMQGQDTLVIINGVGEDTTRVGAGAKIDVGTGGDAKYIGASGSGISEMRTARENDYKEAAEISGKLMSMSREAESGDALRTRIGSRTAGLNQVVLAGAEGLKTILRNMAVWVGANPDEIDVVPNLDFAEDKMDGQTLVSFATAKNIGAPISNETIHELMVENEITKKTYDEELAAIAEEEPTGAPAPVVEEEGSEEMVPAEEATDENQT